jgi:hypothetical protein
MSGFDVWFLNFVPMVLLMAVGAGLWQLGIVIQRRRGNVRVLTGSQVEQLVEQLLLESETMRCNNALRHLLTVEIVSNFQLADRIEALDAASRELMTHPDDVATLDVLKSEWIGVMAARQPVLEMLYAIDKQDWPAYDALRAGTKRPSESPIQ